MASYKEIVTKAVIGKGKKYFKNSYTLTTEIVPSTVLGCWVVNHNFKGMFNNGKIVLEGSCDVNVWYSYDNDTKTSVSSKTISYKEIVSVKIKENAELSNESEIIVRSLKQPTCVKADIKDGNIVLNIEKELGVEVVGDTKMKILVEEDEETWDTIEDEITEDVEQQIDKEIKEEYL